MKQPSEVINSNKSLLKDKKDKCCICGETAYCCLEVHHIHDKVYNISQSVKYLPTRLFKKELDKCICVCSNCHRKIHAKLINL